MTRFSPGLEADREVALKLTPVSRETLAALDAYVALLLDWNTRVNLVARSTLTNVWTRHLADALQLFRWAPEARHWLDLGSGAGVPGLVLACSLRDAENANVDLVEATLKKARFLTEAVTATQAPARVHPIRIEQAAQKLPVPEVVTARALAPLPRLLELAAPFVQAGARGLFLKGKNAEAELTAARESWKLDLVIHPSITDPDGRILDIRSAERR